MAASSVKTVIKHTLDPVSFFIAVSSHRMQPSHVTLPRPTRRPRYHPHRDTTAGIKGIPHNETQSSACAFKRDDRNRATFRDWLKIVNLLFTQVSKQAIYIAPKSKMSVLLRHILSHVSSQPLRPATLLILSRI